VIKKYIYDWKPISAKKSYALGCGKEHKVGYHSSREVIIEDKPISDLRVYLHIIKRRYRCPEDGRIHTEVIPWLNKWSRVTKRFATQINRLTAITTNQEAGWYLGIDDEVIYRIDKGYCRRTTKRNFCHHQQE
jgi:transposase